MSLEDFFIGMFGGFTIGILIFVSLMIFLGIPWRIK